MPNTRMYDAGQSRHKHHWNQSEAGFLPDGSAFVGKCPNTMDVKLAQKLLDEGIAYPDDENPIRIYNVHEGVIYQSVCSGNRCHGYPWRRLPGRDEIPASVLQILECRAMEQGNHDRFKKWLRQYG